MSPFPVCNLNKTQVNIGDASTERYNILLEVIMFVFLTDIQAGWEKHTEDHFNYQFCFFKVINRPTSKIIILVPVLFF